VEAGRLQQQYQGAPRFSADSRSERNRNCAKERRDRSHHDRTRALDATLIDGFVGKETLSPFGGDRNHFSFSSDRIKDAKENLALSKT
jgi:hypothetical protein